MAAHRENISRELRLSVTTALRPHSSTPAVLLSLADHGAIPATLAAGFSLSRSLPFRKFVLEKVVTGIFSKLYSRKFGCYIVR
jgi:hypothetical protein